MSSYGRSKRVKREKWANRMAVLGVTMVVLCLAVAVNAKGSTLKKSDPVSYAHLTLPTILQV